MRASGIEPGGSRDFKSRRVALRHARELAARVGIEPYATDLRGRRPEPLDERAMILAAGVQNRTHLLGLKTQAPPRGPAIELAAGIGVDPINAAL